MLWVRTTVVMALLSLSLHLSLNTVWASPLPSNNARAELAIDSGCSNDDIVAGANWAVSIRIVRVGQPGRVCHDVEARIGVCLEYLGVRLCLVPGESFSIVRT